MLTSIVLAGVFWLDTALFCLFEEMCREGGIRADIWDTKISPTVTTQQCTQKLISCWLSYERMETANTMRFSHSEINKAFINAGLPREAALPCIKEHLTALSEDAAAVRLTPDTPSASPAAQPLLPAGYSATARDVLLPAGYSATARDVLLQWPRGVISDYCYNSLLSFRYCGSFRCSGQS